MAVARVVAGCLWRAHLRRPDVQESLGARLEFSIRQLTVAVKVDLVEGSARAGGRARLLLLEDEKKLRPKAHSHTAA